MTLPGFNAEMSLYKSTAHYRLMTASAQFGGVELQQQLPHCDQNCLDNCLLRCFDFDNACRTECHLRCCTPPPQPPQINVTYQPPPQGSAIGMLTIQGQGFAPDVDVFGRIDNCALNALPIRAHTSQDRFTCFRDRCFRVPGGSFTTAVQCLCGGPGSLICPGAVACVGVRDAAGSVAHGTAPIPCS